MNRTAAVILGGLIGGVLGAVAFGLYIDMTYANYSRDSGVPAMFTGIILGSPVGFVLGLIGGGIWPLKRP